ncbi:MAG: MBL fold metallo-hydrolase [Clostridia bacterium]|nr:MBL fold metallo-hydrolase [Clostridia bacterium]
MAWRRKKKNNPALNMFVWIISLLIGIVGGAFGVTYMTMPYTEELVVGEEPFYSYNSSEVEVIDVGEGDMSIHFLELGNKYTGDSTYIKVGDIDILIDCGSRVSSVATVKSYLDNYVLDGKLEYVIVTHAHQDHYAGFATGVNAKSIFDHFECENIITFSNTNQQPKDEYKDYKITSYAKDSKPESKMYNNFIREIQEEVTNGATHLTATEILNDTTTYPEGKISLHDTKDINLQILNSKYYTTKASSENDYSVCTMFNYGERYFLMTGDLEEEGEGELVDLNPIFTEMKNDSSKYVEVYKAGHHGSKTSSSEKLLQCIKPAKVCVCCCAGSPEYTDTINNQFPTKPFIDRISEYTENIYVTTMCVDYDNDLYESMNGNIVIVVTAETVGVNCSNNNTILKQTDWYKNRQWTN